MSRSWESSTSDAGDPFSLGANAVFQPEMDLRDLVDPPQETEDPIIFYNMRNLLQAWAQSREDLLDQFAQRLDVAGVSRHPVGVVVATMQHVTRELEPIEIPYGGGPVDGQLWPTQDLFELAYVAATVFPAQEAFEVIPLDGQEEILNCADCAGTGQDVCTSCNGAREVSCRICKGSKRLECPQCGGRGAVVDASGRVVKCQACKSNGTIMCDRCVGTGRQTCSKCNGLGQTECGPCEGHGRLKRRWQIDEHVWSEDLRQELATDATWPIATRSVRDELHCIYSVDAPLNSAGTLGNTWADDVPAELHSPIRKLLQQIESKAREVNGASHRVTGVRLEIRGNHGYRVNVQYDVASSDYYVVGQHCRVLCPELPHTVTSFRRWLDKILHLIWYEVDTDLRPLLGDGYLKALRRGRVHVADVKSLVPQVANELAAAIEVEESGYRLTVSVEGSNGRPYEVEIDVTFEMDADETLVLCADCCLVEAHRDVYPAALALGHGLEIGRLAVIDDKRTGVSHFYLCDRRPYEYAEAVSYADVLAVFACEAADFILQGSLN